MFNPKRISNALIYSLKGLTFLIKNEPAFRDDLLIFTILLPIDLFLPNSKIEKTILLSTLFILLIIEILNTCAEKLVDLYTKEKQELAGAIKDMGSFAVFCSLIFLIICHILIFFY